MRGTRAWLPLLAAGVLVLAGCGTDDGGANDGTDAADHPPGEQPDGDSPGGEAPEDTDGVEAVVGGDPDAVDPADLPDDRAFAERAALIVDSWPEPPEPEPDGDPDGELTGVVEVAEAPSDATELTVRVGHGDCDLAWGGWVRESDQVVVLAGWSVRDPDIGACTGRLLVGPVEVELDAPLGDRAVVDAGTGEDRRAAW